MTEPLGYFLRLSLLGLWWVEFVEVDRVVAQLRWQEQWPPLDIAISFDRYQKLRAMFDPVDGAETFAERLLTHDDPLVWASYLQQTW